MNIVLANASYRYHSTDEGDQLQAGLASAGWRLCGPYYDEEGGDVAAILHKHQPQIVFVQDPRDWDAGSKGSFGRRDLHFHGIECLADRQDIFKVCVVKDAGTCTEYQRAMVERVGANAIVTYYHHDSVVRLSPWLADCPLIRHCHTIDASFALNVAWPIERDLAVVTGAISQKVYPLRHRLFHEAAELGVTGYKHPGYGNRRCHTPDYLELLAKYRVHLATCSTYKFALRKIIESVAVGCIPMTNLPAYDCLPEIDGALVRMPDEITDVYRFKRSIRIAAMEWDEAERREWQRKCLAFYDYRAAGKRLSDNIEALSRELAGH